MAAEIVTIPRVYLKDRTLALRSAHHTAYASASHSPIQPGKEVPLLKLEFIQGVVRNVPAQIYQAFADAGVATTDRPRRRSEEKDD